jgi:hypothetical protein
LGIVSFCSILLNRPSVLLLRVETSWISKRKEQGKKHWR